MAADIIAENIGNDLPFDVDFVFPFVDNNDPYWILQHKEMCEKWNRPFNPSGERYRNYKTLKYLFRGINKCMPWVRNVYIIVERKTQIPKWLNTKTVKVIYHADIIPQIKLPTYNSTTIEMFIHNIPDLAEHFIYGNDDVFPVGILRKSDFFNANGYPKLKVNRIKYNGVATSMYRKMIRSSNDLACKDLGLSLLPKSQIIKSNHGLSPMLKSTLDRIYKNNKNAILKSCTPFREPFNYNPELFNSWQYLSKKYSNDYNIKMKYIFIESINSKENLMDAIIHHQVICLNDGRFKKSKDSFMKIRDIMINSFDSYFTTPCKYEI